MFSRVWNFFFFFFLHRQYFTSALSCITMFCRTLYSFVKTKITHTYYDWLWSKAKFYYIWFSLGRITYTFIHSFSYSAIFSLDHPSCLWLYTSKKNESIQKIYLTLKTRLFSFSNKYIKIFKYRKKISYILYDTYLPSKDSFIIVDGWY